MFQRVFCGPYSLEVAVYLLELYVSYGMHKFCRGFLLNKLGSLDKILGGSSFIIMEGLPSATITVSWITLGSCYLIFLSFCFNLVSALLLSKNALLGGL